MIKSGEEQIGRETGETDGTILVLGNAGAGKTTFVQFMAGDNGKLMSKRAGVRHFIIEDGIKIGNSVTESFTLYPERVVFDNETSFTDTPGFRDSRSEKHELVAAYIMKKYLRKMARIKIVFLVTYTSLEAGMYKEDFVDFLENVVAFIKDVDKYKDSFALIATKVPNAYEIARGNATLITDERIVKGIADYLIQVRTSLKDKSTGPIGSKRTTFLENAIKIIDALLDSDDEKGHKKINVFRQPSESGAVSDMAPLQIEKKSIRETLFKNIDYRKISDDDVGYSLSPKSKNYLNCLLWYINDSVSKISSDVFRAIENHYRSKTDRSRDIYSSRLELEKLVRKLKTFKGALKESRGFKNYSSIVQNFITDEGIEMGDGEADGFREIGEHLIGVEQFADPGSALSTLEWADRTKRLVNYAKEHLSWTDDLIKLFQRLSSYRVQKSKESFFNATDENVKPYYKLKSIFLQNFDSVINDEHKWYLNMFTQNGERETEVDRVLSLTLLKPNDITCDGNGKLTAAGRFVRLSEISDVGVVNRHCGEKALRVIRVRAVHTVYVDADLVDERFRGVDLMIAAPVWQVIGKRIINIGGVVGKNHDRAKADDGVDYGESGKDGRPGLPGGNGGNFLGIGLHFENENGLAIYAGGGKGGAGQDGGNGKEGNEGEEGNERFYCEPPNDYNYVESWVGGKPVPPSGADFNSRIESAMESGHCSAKIKLYKHLGRCGGVGGNGGNGGVGGSGGNPGAVLLIGENDPPKFYVENPQGSVGHAGRAGDGGKTGKDGMSIECFATDVVESSHGCGGCHATGGVKYGYGYCVCDSIKSNNRKFWKCRRSDGGFKCPTASSKPGLSNYTSDGLAEPDTRKDYDFSEDLRDFSSILRAYENDTFLSNRAIKFQNEIDRRISSL